MEIELNVFAQVKTFKAHGLIKFTSVIPPYESKGHSSLLLTLGLKRCYPAEVFEAIGFKCFHLCKHTSVIYLDCANRHRVHRAHQVLFELCFMSRRGYGRLQRTATACYHAHSELLHHMREDATGCIAAAIERV